MTAHVGILDARVLGREEQLKQAALAFDNLVIAGGGLLQWVKELAPSKVPESFRREVALFEHLVDAGVALPPDGGTVHASFGGKTEGDVVTSFLSRDEFGPFRDNLFAGWQAASREEQETLVRGATERMLRRAAAYYRRTRGWDAVVVNTGAADRTISEPGPDTVTSVVLAEMPMPDDSVPWEAIVDFRNDAEAKRKYLALRTWINSAATSGRSAIDLADELRHLTAEYEDYMRLQRLKSRRGVLRTVLSVTAGVVEGVVRVKPTQIVDALFTVSDENVRLLEAERSAPGRELAYIVDAQARFQRR